ncbi:MAG: capsule assembly Wzi family protein [Rhodothermales bacterium]
MNVIRPPRRQRAWLRPLLMGLAALAWCLPQTVRAQPGPWTYEGAVFMAGASERALPFWLHTNRYGTIDRNGFNVGTRWGIRRAGRITGRMTYEAGAGVVGRVSDRSTLYVHELYGRVSNGLFQARAGRYEDAYGMVDPRLSLGSMIWSRNAAPMPKISVGTEGFLPIPGTRDLVAFSAYVGQGWMARDAYVDRALLHEKYLYLRVLPPDFPVHATGGVIHNVVWGGDHPIEGELGHGLKDLIRVALAQAGEDLQFEADNALGNTVAMYDTRIEIETKPVLVTMYREFYIETGGGLLFRNARDGLWGLRLDFARPFGPFTSLLWEHLYTKQQSTNKEAGDTPGRANYYNNVLYRDGWTYHGRTIGMPLLRTDGIRPGVINHLVAGHHAGLAGEIGPDISFLGYVTYSRNYGAANICGDPDCTTGTSELTDRLDQWSVYLTTTTRMGPHRQLALDASIAFDAGPYAPNAFGAALGVRWAGMLGSKKR